MNLDRPTIITLVICMLGTGLGVRLLAIPEWRGTAERRAETADLQQRMASISDQESAEVRLTAEYERMSGEAIEAMRVVPAAPDEARVMRRLTLPIDGVTVTEQQIVAGTATDALVDGPVHGVPEGAVPITVDMRADFESVFALVRSAERMDELVRVDSVRMVLPNGDRDQTGGGDGWSTLVDATVGLSIVYQRPDLEGMAP